MPVRIRLAQRGKKKNRTFRVIVADSRSPRDGKFIEDLGYYCLLYTSPSPRD